MVLFDLAASSPWPPVGSTIVASAIPPGSERIETVRAPRISRAVDASCSHSARTRPGRGSTGVAESVVAAIMANWSWTRITGALQLQPREAAPHVVMSGRTRVVFGPAGTLHA